jgi:flagellar basal body rod protein FlgC
MISNISSLTSYNNFFNNTANNIANAGNEAYQNEDVLSSGPSTYNPETDGVSQVRENQISLEKEMTDMIEIEKGFEANVEAIRTQNEMKGSLINILA